MLSLGCGIGDTELLLAPHVGFASRGSIFLRRPSDRLARMPRLAGVTNVQFLEASAARAGSLMPVSMPSSASSFCTIFPMPELEEMARRIRGWLKPGGVFYGLDPSRYRLSGALERVWSRVSCAAIRLPTSMS